VGQKVAVTNLDIAGFTVREFTVHGMNSQYDPLPVNAGKMTVSFVSGNPQENPIFYMPMIVLAGSVAVIIVLLKTKKRTT
jgi:hypothetical protein